ncbi:MAG: hypothetical protein QOD92_2454 [Acidimicrobiaceae bacterium]
MALVTVEEVSGRAAFKRFFEFAYMQFISEPRWSPPLVVYERKRTDPHHRYFDEGDGEYFLARRRGNAAGRIAAHIAAKGEEQGWFGFYDAIDDPAVTAELVEQAAAWLREHGCTTMTGPASFTVADDPGVLVEGFDAAGTTGRPWHPPWYAAHLEAVALTRIDESRTWRIPTTPHELGVIAPAMTGVTTPSSRMIGMVGRFADPRLLLPGIVAVPDLTPARNSAVALARRAKRNDWEGCTIVEIEGDPVDLVPQLQAAAAEAGYQWVISPWSPDPDTPPETVHVRFTTSL